MSDGEIGHNAGGGDDSVHYSKIPSYVFACVPDVGCCEVFGPNKFDGASLVFITDESFLVGFEDPKAALKVGRGLIKAAMEMLGEEGSGCIGPDDPTDIDELGDGDENNDENCNGV